MYIYLHLFIHTYITFHYITLLWINYMTWHIHMYIYICAHVSPYGDIDTRRHLQCVHVPPLNTKSKAGPLLDRGLLPAQSLFELKILSCWLRSRSSQTSRKNFLQHCKAPYKAQSTPVWAAWPRLPHRGTYSSNFKMEKNSDDLIRYDGS